jgi:uncharacterized protein (TIGR03790 family)
VDRLVRSVLVVTNERSEVSQEIGAYYVSKRGIPMSNLVSISVEPREEISRSGYLSQFEIPLKKWLSTNGRNIDYIVLTKDVPFRLAETGYSVDAQVAGIPSDVKAISELSDSAISRARNAYFGSKEPFSTSKFKMYLVTRLDGYSVDDVKRLVDNSLNARASKGPFLIDEAANMKSGAYGEFQSTFSQGVDTLKSRKFKVVHDQEREFATSNEALMGYASWGSNDNQLRAEIFRKLIFQPGAIAETFVSTSARTFKPAEGGQSLIADLIRGGVTGVKGYCSEPYLFAMANPSILVDRYTAGFNLAESFYAASPILKWKDIIIGDPLCRPYQR